MRSALLLSLLLLASCSSGGPSALSTAAPGMDVADAALSNGAPDTALHIAQRALVSNPNDLQALLIVGNAQAMLGRTDQAVQSFSRVLVLAPHNIDAELGLGRLKLATEPAGAAVLFQHVADRAPKNVAALVDLGIASDLLGRHVDAQQAYRRALAVEPGHMAAKVNLGLSLALSGDAQEAVRILQPLATGPETSPRIRQDLAVALVLAGDPNSASSMLKADIARPEILATITAYQTLRPAP